MVVVIDELADLLQACGAELEMLISRLVQRGRSCRFFADCDHAETCYQGLVSLVKANFPVRFDWTRRRTDDARVAAGIGGTGAEKLAGRGDFFLIAAGETIRFQAACVRPEEIASLGAREKTPSMQMQPGLSSSVVGWLRKVK